MAARKRASIGAPPPKKSKIHIGAFFYKWGLVFYFEALFRLSPLPKNSVEVHGREQTRCGYCNKGTTNTYGASNVMFVYALQKPETAT